MLTVDNITVFREKAKILEDVSVSLERGKTLAVVGESGAGKSTLIAAILGLVRVAEGQINWAGKPVKTSRPALVMQEPRTAFNPVLSLRHSVLEPVQTPDEDRLEHICSGLEIPSELLDRKPGEVSIGQIQRVGILRALISAPPLILLDEPLSALDAVTQKQTAQLIAALQHEERFAAFIVTHDLGYAAAYADDIAVLRAGRIEELSSSQAFIEAPKTEYGRVLRDAAFSLGAIGRAA